MRRPPGVNTTSAQDTLDTATVFSAYASGSRPDLYTDSLQVRASYDRLLDPFSRLRVELPFTQTLAGKARDLELTPRVDLVRFGPGYSLQLTAEHRLDLDGEAYPFDTYYSLSRLPEVTYTLLGQALQLGSVGVSTQVTAGLGVFGERNVFTGGPGPEDLWAVRLDLQALAFAAHALDLRTTADARLAARLIYYTTGQLRLVAASTLGLQYQWSPEFFSRLSHTYYYLPDRHPGGRTDRRLGLCAGSAGPRDASGPV
ncbi:MAG: hypothetical protein C4303_06385, partial [candidate division GAL15 bacterium]